MRFLKWKGVCCADSLYLQKAETLGSSLLMAFDTKSGIPSSTVNLHNPARKSMVNPLNGQKYNFGDPTTLAEAGSVQLEFAALGARTANDTYSSAARRALDALLHVPRNGAAQKSHVLPVDVHPQRKRFEVRNSPLFHCSSHDFLHCSFTVLTSNSWGSPTGGRLGRRAIRTTSTC